MKCILVPIDFADVTAPVIDLARQLAKALGAEIHLLHVKELTAAATPGTLGYGLAGMPELAPMSGVPVPGSESMPETIPEDEGQTSKLAKWQEEIAQDGIKVSLHKPTGTVAEEILNQADALNADMIVMGRHGHGAMYNLLVGSTTKGVLKHSTRPVPGARSQILVKGLTSNAQLSTPSVQLRQLSVQSWTLSVGRLAFSLILISRRIAGRDCGLPCQGRISEKPMDEIPERAASAICWFGAHGCDRNYHRGRLSPSWRRLDCRDDRPGDLHCHRRMQTHVAGDLRHRWLWLFPAAQP